MGIKQGVDPSWTRGFFSHHPERAGNILEEWGVGFFKCSELHRTHGQGHHHLAIVVVEMGTFFFLNSFKGWMLEQWTLQEKRSSLTIFHSQDKVYLLKYINIHKCYLCQCQEMIKATLTYAWNKVGLISINVEILLIWHMLMVLPR